MPGDLSFALLVIAERGIVKRSIYLGIELRLRIFQERSHWEMDISGSFMGIGWRAAYQSWPQTQNKQHK